MFVRLEDAAAACPARIVVKKVAPIHVRDEHTASFSTTEAMTAGAPANRDPYREPIPVEAAGGILVRRRTSGREVLLIRRRGVWDLPKGKRDAGESLEVCARREVSEELGIDRVDLVRPLGQTIHGYVDGNRYAVKTTHWYQMHTDVTSFQPEKKEGIQAVAWFPWRVAIDQLGFEVLRRHLEAVDSQVVVR